MRSGSTWLTTMLGSLSDVFVDRELKWRPTYELQPIHLPIRGAAGEITDVLRAYDCMEPIVGSKLTFDPIDLPMMDFQAIQNSVSPETKVIHLSRNFLEVFLSVRRGYFHLPNHKYESKIGETLMMALKASANALGEQDHAPAPPTRQDCLQQLLLMLKNDLLVFEHFSRTFDYLCVDYGQITPRFDHLAKFIGSSASPQEIMALQRDPTTLKLPAVTYPGVEDHLELFTRFERIRTETLPFI